MVWLPLLPEVLGNIYLALVCSPVCDVINYGILDSFFKSNHFSSMTKNSRQKFKYLVNEKSF